MKTLRKRIPLAHYTAKPDGQLIVRKQTQSTFTRTRNILKELGQDVKEYEREQRLKQLFKMSELGLL
jgi:hypothetical protein